jgi:MoxR-like ATPase
MADEINRASPRTQSALLQAMQEKEVTIAGQHRPAAAVSRARDPEPDRAGGHLSAARGAARPFPAADRRRVSRPRQTERDILIATTGIEDAEAHQVFDAGLMAAQKVIRRMPVGRAGGRGDPRSGAVGAAGHARGAHLADAVSWGPGPRAAQALMLAIRARALLSGRLVPSMDDVAALAQPVLMHRMALGFAARAEGQTLHALIARLVDDVTGREVAA